MKHKQKIRKCSHTLEAHSLEAMLSCVHECILEAHITKGVESEGSENLTKGIPLTREGYRERECFYIKL